VSVEVLRKIRFYSSKRVIYGPSGNFVPSGKLPELEPRNTETDLPLISVILHLAPNPSGRL
jgi:hypothetical protein